MKYEQCKNCYWKYNADCIRPKGDLCPGKLGNETKKEKK